MMKIQKTLSLIFGLAGLILVIWGRVATYHCTEGEAFIKGWKFWLAAAGCALLGLWLTRKE